MSTRRKILWEYWQNPFGGYGPEYVKEEDVSVPLNAWEEKEKEEESREILVRPVIPTPMGPIPVQPFRVFTDVFEFWFGHTNFYINDDIKEILEFTPGVEIFDLFTPYRFRICIGKAFTGADVKYRIQENLNALPPKQGEINPRSMRLDKATQDKVSLIEADIKNKFSYWAIYVMPNGEIDVSGSNTEEGYQMHLQLYSNALEVAGGLIYKYA